MMRLDACVTGVEPRVREFSLVAGDTSAGLRSKARSVTIIRLGYRPPGHGSLAWQDDGSSTDAPFLSESLTTYSPECV